MKMKVRTTVFFVVLLCVGVLAFAYTRPLTIEQRYPVLDLAQCTQIRGYYYDGTGVEDTRFTIEPDDPHFDEVVELFQSAAFRKSLRNLFPQGTKIHRYSDGDFAWEVMFRFENVRFPSGDVGSGDMLHIRNFFGEISLFFDGEEISCSLRDQAQWAGDVMRIVTQHPVSSSG